MNKDGPQSTIVRKVLSVLTPEIDNSAALCSRLVNSHLRSDRLRCGSMTTLMIIVIFSMAFLLSFVPSEAQASAGSYSLKWYAADPSANGAPYLPTYEKLMPGSLPSPGTVGRYADPLSNAVAYGPTSNSLDAVTSLAPKDLAIGQIIPYEMVIKVSGNTAPENGTIKFTTSFDTNTTSGDNFGFDPAYMVYAAFVDTADVGTIDPGNNAKVDNFTSTLTGTGVSQQIQGTFNVSGLDNGDRVVVEIWVVLKSNIPASSSGNVHTGLLNAQTSSGSKISTGEQTIPLLKVKEFSTSKADISIVKTDSSDPVIQGQNITYTLVVKNNSPDTIANGINITDSLDLNTSFVSATGASYTINGNNITFSLGALSPSKSAILSIVAKISDTVPAIKDLSIDPEPGTPEPPALYDVVNNVSGTAITSDPNIDNNAYYQPTNVLLALPVYFIDKKVIDVSGRGPTGNVTSAGDIIEYQINVSNVGNIDLTNVTMNDSMINLSGPTGDIYAVGTLNVGETWTYAGNYTVTQADINSNGGGDGIISNTATVDCDQLAPKSRIAEVPVKAKPACIINKIVTDVAGNGPAGEVTASGEVISYLISVNNTGNVDLTNITLNDSLITQINLTGPTGDNSSFRILNVGETWTYTGNYTVTQADINSNGGGDEIINNTVTVACDQLEPQSHTAEVPVKAKPAYIIDKKVMDIAGNGTAGIITASGEEISYQINVSNVGNIDLTNITLNDSLISSINLMGPLESANTDGILGIGEVWTYNGNYTVNQTDIDSNGGGNGLIENTATVDCDQLDPKFHTAEVPIQGAAAYIIDKKVTGIVGNGPAGFVTDSGDLIGYQINVSNVGSVSLTNVTLNDSLIDPINLTGPVESLNLNGILEPGEIWTYNGNYTVNQTDINSNGGGDGAIENTATVDCYQLDPKSHTAEVPIKTPAYIIHKIITNVSGKGPSGYVSSEGDTISYQVNVSNVGDVNLTNLTLNDSLVDLTGPEKSLNADEILEPGETWIYTGIYTVTQKDINHNGTADSDIDETNGADGDIDNIAIVDCDQLAPKSQSAEVPVKSEPAYIINEVVTDVAGKGPSGYVTSAGDIISYLINVTNVGNVDLTNVTLDSRINLTGPIEYINPDGVLKPGETWTYTGNYSVTKADINYNGTASDDYDDRYGPDGDVDSYATVDCDQLDPKTRNVEVQFGRPVYMIDKTVTDVAGAGPAGDVRKAGDIISYQINVSNIGNLDLGNVTVNDSLIYLAEKTGDNDPVGILKVGETWVYTGNYTVSEEDINNTSEGQGLINNTATVNSTLLGPEKDSINVPIMMLPAYTVNKTIIDVANRGPEGSIKAAGDVITYQINVSNIGKVNLTNLTLNDSLVNLTDPTESLNTDSILEIGESWIYNLTYTVTQEDMNNRDANDEDIDDIGGEEGEIDNIATVDCDQLAPNKHVVDVPVERNPEYSIFKSVINPDADGDCIINSPGDKIPYRIVVKNEGNMDLTNITVNDTLINLTGPTGNDTEEGVLHPGETWLYTGIYTLKPGDINNGAGYINNTATVRCDELPEKNSRVDTPIDQNADLSIYKSVTGVDEAGDYTINDVGDIIQYQIAVKNNGNIDLTGISVSDPKVNLIKISGDSADQGVLNPRETWVYAGNYSVTQEDINRAKEGIGIIENTATISCKQLSDKSSSLELPIIYIPPILVAPEPENYKALPVADFITNVTSGYAPLSVQFTDKSQKATSWSWDFDNDGKAESGDRSPVYMYTAPGIYTTKQTVSNVNGSNSTTAAITVLQRNDSFNGGSGDNSGGGANEGKAVIVRNEANNSTDGRDTTAVITSSEGITQNPGNNKAANANVERTHEQQATTTPEKESKKVPGFDMICGITALLALFLSKRK